MGRSHRPLIIAHRGASGYLPEHTLAGKALAVGMKADYLEQDVVATRDGQLVVCHDLWLEDTTDVRRRFPERSRQDGHYYCLDFSLEEIRSLRVSERRVSGGEAPRYPGRFPATAALFEIHTFEEELSFIRGLATATGRGIGIYPEIKAPAWHRAQGMDISRQILETLCRFGYESGIDPVYLQCFDPMELQRLRREFQTPLRLIQLIDLSDGSTVTVSRGPGVRQLDEIAEYADGIGPDLRLMLGKQRPDGGFAFGSLLADAHARELAVHPYTFRVDDLPVGLQSFAQLLEIFVVEQPVDGLFTDFPDRVAEYLDRACSPWHV